MRGGTNFKGSDLSDHFVYILFCVTESTDPGRVYCHPVVKRVPELT